MRSGKEVAKLLPDQGAIVGSYGDYSTSAVFYSSYMIPRLIPEHESQEQNAWAGKYTMPTEKISMFNESTANIPMSYIIVNKKNQPDFMGQPFSKDFQLIGTTSNILLYQRMIRER